MRRRLFWTIAGVAAATGILVLAATVFASQQAAVDATYRELQVSADEAVNIIDEFLGPGSRRPGAVLEVLGLLEGDELAPLFGRIRRTAGGSEIGFGIIAEDGTLRTNADLFDRVELAGQRLREGESSRTTSDTGELVVVTPTTIRVRGAELTLLVGIAREAPIVRLSDRSGGLLLLFAGIVVLAAVAARVLGAQLVNRLEPLAIASRRLAGGDMTVRVPELGDPDLDQVGAAFNDMAGELEATRDREREFILGVGHDLRTPLTTIGGYAEALEVGDLSEGELTRIGSVLGAQIGHLGRLIGDITTLARLDQPEFSLQTEVVDVGAHISEIVAGYEKRAESQHVSLKVDADRGIELVTDPDRLAQIAQNLVENALRHTPESGSIEVAVRWRDSGVELSVTDSGTGIAPEDLPHVFDRHYVGRQAAVRREGAGLGLSIVKGLVEKLGGSVSVKSQLGSGTRFIVTFPGPAESSAG